MKFLLHTRLSTRILSFFMSLMVILFVSVLASVLWIYSDDKLAYVYDAHEFQLERIVERVKKQVEEMKSESLIATEVRNSFALGIPRPPEGDEAFFGRNDDDDRLFYRTKGNSIVFQNMSKNWSAFFPKLVADTLHRGNPTVYWMTSFGRTLASVGIDQNDKLVDRTIVKKFLSSSLSQTVTQVIDEHGRSVGAFREVPGTNTAIFIETPFSEVFRPMRAMVFTALLIGVLIFSFTGFLGVMFFNRLWRPIRDVGTMTARISMGQYDFAPSYKYKDEISFVFERIQEMAHNIQKRESALIQAERQLSAEQSARVSLEQSLETARLVQHNLLPSDLSKILPTAIDFNAHYSPCEKVGGDWYSVFYDEKDKTLYAYVGDVTGHGTGSALLSGVTAGCALGTTVLQTQIANNMGCYFLSREESIAAIRDSLAKVIADVGRGEYFLTFFLLSLNVETGELYYLSAGHPAPFFFRKADETIEMLTETSDIIGIQNERPEPWTIGKRKLQSGDQIFVYTDGLKENKGPSESCLSSKKLHRLLKKVFSENRSSKEGCKQIVEHTKTIWQDTPPADDVTFFLLKWMGEAKKKAS